MANKHYTTEREFEVTLTMKVKVTSISNYQPLSDDGLKEVLDDVERELSNDIKYKVLGEYYAQEVSALCDFVNYEIKDPSDE